MKTREKGFFSWITGSGDLKLEVLDEDVARITAFYHNQGYIRARVGEPKVEFKKDSIEIITAFYHNQGYIRARVGEPKLEFKKDSIEIILKIDEGPRFKVGKVDLEGDFLIPKEALPQGSASEKIKNSKRGILQPPDRSGGYPHAYRLLRRPWLCLCGCITAYFRRQ
jgi:outer membrane protein insertion porin family